MRVSTSFVVPEGADYRRVLTGPVWTWGRAHMIFGALDLAVDLNKGQLELERVKRALEVANLRIHDRELLDVASAYGVTPEALAAGVDSLRTWCAAAKLQRATHLAWRREDY